MALQEYREKRDFRITSEPPPKARKSKSGRFYCIQKHEASHLHFDFRLEHHRVLKSWAIPKGPSIDHKTRRLAMEVEDHPLDYGNFEGIIPEGEYGGGTVMLWDRGTWEPLDDPDEGFRRGKITFRLHGKRLRGVWTLVRSHGGAYGNKNKNAWFLMKTHDPDGGDEEEYTREPVERELTSVVSGRPMADIAAGKGRRARRVWASDMTPSERRAAVEPLPAHREPARRSTRHRATKTKLARLPAGFRPELATLVDDVPKGSNWLHEVKFDGYRIITLIRNGKVKFLSRNNKDWTEKIPAMAEAIEALGIRNGILDGELVAVNEKGVSDFQALQNAFRENSQAALIYQVFDVINHEGEDLRGLPLAERKAVLKQIFRISKTSSSRVKFSEHIVGQGQQLFDQACRIGLEGIVSKRADSRYVNDRTTDWVKVKCLHRQEFVVVGYTAPKGSRIGFGSLLLAVYEGKAYRYVGHAGTGFNANSLKAIKERLDRLTVERKPDISDPAGELRREKDVTWVKPKLVAEVKFAEWTRGMILRQAVFEGLREDKAPRDVRFEKPKHASSVEREPSHKGKSKPVKTLGEDTPIGFAAPEAVKFTNANKTLFTPDITKGDLAQYYTDIKKWILPYLLERPLAVVRCPDGHEKMCFFQKHEPEGRLGAEAGKFVKNGKTNDYMFIDSFEGLIALVQQGVLELHGWQASVGAIEKPDQIVFDLDPDPSLEFADVVDTAIRIRDRLKKIKLKSFVKTTGGKGLHIVVPLKPVHSWDEVKDFARIFAETLVAEFPDCYTSSMAKHRRQGKIFVDYLRNGRGATAIVPYSTRAKSGAPVAVPVSWQELPKIASANQFTLRNIRSRLSRLRTDPWKDFSRSRQRLPDLSKF